MGGGRLDEIILPQTVCFLVSKIQNDSECLSVYLPFLCLKRFWGNMIIMAPIQDNCLKFSWRLANEHLCFSYFYRLSVGNSFLFSCFKIGSFARWYHNIFCNKMQVLVFFWKLNIICGLGMRVDSPSTYPWKEENNLLWKYQSIALERLI